MFIRQSIVGGNNLTNAKNSSSQLAEQIFRREQEVLPSVLQHATAYAMQELVSEQPPPAQPIERFVKHLRAFNRLRKQFGSDPVTCVILCDSLEDTVRRDLRAFVSKLSDSIDVRAARPIGQGACFDLKSVERLLKHVVE
jgi:hypothetical protein